MKNRIDSWISRARIYTIDKIFLEPPWFSTSWKISWNGKLRAFGKEETSFRVDGIGIDSALGATILFNSRNADIDCRDCCSPSTVHRVSRSSINQTNCRPRHLIACFEIRDAHPSHAFLQHLRSGGRYARRFRVESGDHFSKFFLLLFFHSFIYLFTCLFIGGEGRRFNFFL